jgi:hypothetical protein
MTDDLLAPPDPQEPSDYLEAQIGPGGKFHRDNRDEALQELAKGKWKSDEFIRLKNMQYDSLYQAYNEKVEQDKTRESLESLLAKVEKVPLASSNHPANEDPTPAKPEDIRNLVSEEVTKMRRQDQEQANFDLVRNKLTEQFGENYAPAVRKRITDLGLTPERFNQWAREAPQAVLNALGTSEPKGETFQAPPQTNRTFKPVTEQKRKWSYYQELKKTNPKLYHDPKIMNQMLADAEALGAEFEDGDFNTRNL